MKFKDDLQKELYYRSQIDFCYYMLAEVYKDLNEKRPAIETMIDNATGYTGERLRKKTETVRSLMKTIIRCKKALGIDVSRETEAMKKLPKVKKNDQASKKE